MFSGSTILFAVATCLLTAQALPSTLTAQALAAVRQHQRPQKGDSTAGAAAASLLQLTDPVDSVSEQLMDLPISELVTLVGTGRMPTSSAPEEAHKDFAQKSAGGGVATEIDAEGVATVMLQSLSEANASKSGSDMLSSQPTYSPAQVQGQHILYQMDDYASRLALLRTQADQQYRNVVDREAQLVQNFAPLQARLQVMVDQAMTLASRNEVTAMLERLTRIHFEQVAGLDRSARFFEERLQQEREMTRRLEAQERVQVGLRNLHALMTNQTTNQTIQAHAPSAPSSNSTLPVANSTLPVAQVQVNSARVMQEEEKNLQVQMDAVTADANAMIAKAQSGQAKAAVAA